MVVELTSALMRLAVKRVDGYLSDNGFERSPRVLFLIVDFIEQATS